MSATTSPAHIRCCIRRDLAEVVAIDALSYEEPWSAEDFNKELARRNQMGTVAEHGDRVVAYMLHELKLTSLIVHRLAVHPGWRRMGIASQMLRRLTAKLTPEHRRKVVVDVHETAVAAQLCLRGCWFLATDILRGRDGDVYRMVCEVREEE
jgi:ribosomal-protein-alanine N-acetyltransferase